MNKKILLSDEEFLKLCKAYTYQEVADRLKVSYSSCWNKGRRLGLKKKPGRVKGKTELKFKSS